MKTVYAPETFQALAGPLSDLGFAPLYFVAVVAVALFATWAARSF